MSAAVTERPPALDEQETLFSIEATDRKTVTVFSNDSVWQGRMAKLGIEPFRHSGYGKWYQISLDEFGFGVRKKKQLSDEQRAANTERLAAAREARYGDSDDDENEDV